MKYRGYRIEGTQEHMDHYVVVDRDGCNALPGAVFPASVVSAKQYIDMLELVGPDKFWEVDNLIKKYDNAKLNDPTVKKWELFKYDKAIGAYMGYKTVAGTYREVLEKHNADSFSEAALQS